MNLFLLNIPLRWLFAARNPNSELAFVEPLAIVHYSRNDGVTSALLRDKSTFLRRFLRFNAAKLFIDRDFIPRASIELPVFQNGFDLNIATGDQSAIDVRYDRFDIDLFTFLDERPRGSNADIK